MDVSLLLYVVNVSFFNYLGLIPISMQYRKRIDTHTVHCMGFVRYLQF